MPGTNIFNLLGAILAGVLIAGAAVVNYSVTAPMTGWIWPGTGEAREGSAGLIAGGARANLGYPSSVNFRKQEKVWNVDRLAE